MGNVHNTEKFLQGIKLATKDLRKSYGQYGINAIIECEEYPYNKVTNDAWTIIDAIKTNDREERQGLNLFKELVDRQNSLSGDGRKTTAIIAETLIEEGLKLDIPKVELKRQLDALIPKIEKELDKKTKKIEPEEIDQVAKIAGESEEFGRLLKEIYMKMGKDCLIDPQPSGTTETSYKITEGVRFQNTGFLSNAMATDEKKQIAIYENPLILVTKRKLTKLSEINPILNSIQSNPQVSGSPLIIFTDDMDSDVARNLINTHVSKAMKILIVKASVLWKNEVFEDFSKCVGATIIEDATGKTFKNLMLSDLGTCGKITVDSSETILTGIKDISGHIEELKSKNDDVSKLRLSWLCQKNVTLLLGANGENDLYYKMAKLKDAISSSRLALVGGVIEGCGKTLSEIDIGNQIIAKALKAPRIQLVENAKGLTLGESWDATLVLKNSIRNAIALASTALTVGIVIPIIEKTPEEIALLQVNKKLF